MVTHLDIGDGRYAEAAAAILRRHDNFEAEANITTAVRDFLILTGLADGDEIVEENPPSDDSRRAVDLTALDTFIEFKRRDRHGPAVSIPTPSMSSNWTTTWKLPKPPARTPYQKAFAPAS